MSKADKLLKEALRYMDRTWDYESPIPEFMGLRQEINDYLFDATYETPFGYVVWTDARNPYNDMEWVFEFNEPNPEDGYEYRPVYLRPTLREGTLLVLNVTDRGKTILRREFAISVSDGDQVELDLEISGESDGV